MTTIVYFREEEGGAYARNPARHTDAMKEPS